MWGKEKLHTDNATFKTEQKQSLVSQVGLNKTGSLNIVFNIFNQGSDKEPDIYY